MLLIHRCLLRINSHQRQQLPVPQVRSSTPVLSIENHSAIMYFVRFDIKMMKFRHKMTDRAARAELKLVRFLVYFGSVLGLC
jgi:hypothetical protein